MDQWLYWVGSRVSACMCCVSVGFSRTDRNELWQLPCLSPSGATSVPVYAPCVTMWWRDCSCGVRAAATVDIWSTWWTGSKAALTALPAAVTCASTPELLTTTVNTAGPLWECGKTHTQTARQDVFILLRGPGVFAHQEKGGRLWSELRPEIIRGLHGSPGRLHKNKYNHVFANDVWFCLYEQKFIYMDAAFYSF